MLQIRLDDLFILFMLSYFIIGIHKAQIYFVVVLIGPSKVNWAEWAQFKMGRRE